MTGSIRNFEKLNFTPKLSVFCSSQGQTSKYDRLAHWDSGLGTVVLGQYSLGTVQSSDSGLGTVVLGQWSCDSGLGTVQSWDSGLGQWSRDSCLGTVVLGQYSLGTVILGQWSWDSGLRTVVLGQYSLVKVQSWDSSLRTVRSWDGTVLGQYI